MANGHGGKRPNSGRKPKDIRVYQQRMRAVFGEVVTQEDWLTVVAVALAHAKAGDKAAREWLAPWIVGKVPDEVKHTGDSDQPIEMVVKVVRSSGRTRISNTDSAQSTGTDSD